MGGKKYRKHEDVDKDDGDINVAVGTADEKTEMQMQMQKLEIAEVEQKSTQSTETETNKLVGKKVAKQRQDTHRKEEARNKKDTVRKTVWDTPWTKNSGIDEIRKPNLFFSGEDALKDS